MIYKIVGIIVILIIGLYPFSKILRFYKAKKTNADSIYYLNGQVTGLLLLGTSIALAICSLVLVIWTSAGIASILSIWPMLMTPMLIENTGIVILKDDTITLRLSNTIKLSDINNVKLVLDKRQKKIIKLYKGNGSFSIINGNDTDYLGTLYKKLKC